MDDKLTQYEILAEYECLHNGWDMDSEAYVARRKDNNHIVILQSNHGQFQEYRGAEAVKKLNDWIHMYSNTIISVKKAMQILVEEMRNANRKI